jgi:hypothetical protein
MNVKRDAVDAHRRWRRGVTAMAAAAGLAVAGCGGDASGDRTETAGASKAADPRAEQAVAYAQCMRENGVPAFPDPVNGQIRLRAGEGLDPESSAFKAAAEACQDEAPAGGPGGGGAQMRQDVQATVLKYARCMRKNGVPEFPDPQVSDGRVQMRLPQGVDEDSSAFRGAQQKCQEIMQGLGGGSR